MNFRWICIFGRCITIIIASCERRIFSRNSRLHHGSRYNLSKFISLTSHFHYVCIVDCFIWIVCGNCDFLNVHGILFKPLQLSRFNRYTSTEWNYFLSSFMTQSEKSFSITCNTFIEFTLPLVNLWAFIIQIDSLDGCYGRKRSFFRITPHTFNQIFIKWY